MNSFVDLLKLCFLNRKSAETITPAEVDKIFIQDAKKGENNLKTSQYKEDNPLLKSNHTRYWKEFSNIVNIQTSLLWIISSMDERFNFHVLVLMTCLRK